MKSEIRIGTRKSELSMAQTELVADAIRAVCPDVEPVLVGRSTIGDQILDKPLLAFGGKGVFVSGFEEALLQGEIDLAVHSAKDLPMDLAEGLEIIGALPRGDVRDVLVTMADRPVVGIVQDVNGRTGGICIGTSSLRRKIQIEELGETLWPGRRVVCQNLRGNVLTRLDKLESGQYDGILLAAAGLDRLKIRELRKGRYGYRYLTPEEMIPAGGQGILAIEGIKGGPMEPIVKRISDPLAMVQLQAERQVLKRLNAGCHEPVGVYCRTWAGARTDRADVQQLLLTGIYEKDGVRRRAEVRAAGSWEKGPQEEISRLLTAAADDLADRLLGKR